MTMQTDIADMLGRTALFGGLPRGVLTAIAAAMRSQAYDAGQTIFSRPDAAAGLYLVTSGRVRLSVASPEGRDAALQAGFAAEAVESVREQAAIEAAERGSFEEYLARMLGPELA